MQEAIDEFLEYTSSFFTLLNDSYDIYNINLKINHTFRVMDLCGEIAESLNLTKEDITLAKLCGLLHDIGRFEQWNRYKTFVDSKSVDHGDFGAKLLKEKNFIRRFNNDEKIDDLIIKVVKNHNKYAIDSELNDQELLHAKLIRDADKLDNFRVQDTEEMRTLLDKSESEIGKQSISPSVIDDFMSGKLVNRKNTNNEIDRWISYIACIFDINYNASLNFLLNKKYIEKLFNRIPYTNPDTIKQVEKLKSFVSSYINKKLSEELVGNYGK